jgi:hypothetical protein
MKTDRKEMSDERCDNLISLLKNRFEHNAARHLGINWEPVEFRLKENRKKLWSLNEMEDTGGEPDVIGIDETGAYIFFDCSKESPAGRRSVCYDREGLDSRKEFKPLNSAVEMAAAMGIDLLTEEQYYGLQQLGNFDAKTSSWLATPAEVRKLGGSIFGDYRYGKVFVYHNGAQSYYAARGFRGLLRV